MVIYMFRAIWEFAQSADCVVQIEDPQNACQSADSQIARNIYIVELKAA